MKNTIKVAAVITSLLFPVGIALADQGIHLGAGVSGNTNTVVEHRESDLEIGTGANVDIDNDSDERGSATSTERDHGKQGEKMETEHASSTTDRDDDRGNATSSEKEGHGKSLRGGLFGFFQWLFKLPATTTVGDIRAQLSATTTASTSLNLAPQGLGFWAKIFGFLGFNH